MDTTKIYFDAWLHQMVEEKLKKLVQEAKESMEHPQSEEEKSRMVKQILAKYKK